MQEIDGEKMHKRARIRIGRGFRRGMAYSVTGLRILRDERVDRA